MKELFHITQLDDEQRREYGLQDQYPTTSDGVMLAVASYINDRDVEALEKMKTYHEKYVGNSSSEPEYLLISSALQAVYDLCYDVQPGNVISVRMTDGEIVTGKVTNVDRNVISYTSRGGDRWCYASQVIRHN